MVNVLEVNNVYKKLGKKEIIKGISFSIKEGEIFGFLGPNGAGKTTTIRMLVGLIAPDKGDIKVLSHNIQKDREKALSGIGAVVENPELYTYLTGRQNLIQLSNIYGNISKEDINEVINIVGLTDRIDEKVKKYSLGMKQRLGLAEALLSKPKLLILDEPTNGLDPSGIIEFRILIKQLSRERNMAVFISSHILSEIELLCDTVAFIDNGLIKSVESLKNLQANIDSENVILIAREKEKCSQLLNTIPYVYSNNLDKGKFKLNIEKQSIPKLIIELCKHNITIEEVYKKQQMLEDRYIEIVEGGLK